MQRSPRRERSAIELGLDVNEPLARDLLRSHGRQAMEMGRLAQTTLVFLNSGAAPQGSFQSP